jgi:hypothetical protein
MVGKTNEQWLPNPERDAAWYDMMRETYPTFFRLELGAGDAVQLREDAKIAMGALTRVIALCDGPCPNMHATMLECSGVLKAARMKIAERHGKKRRFRKANRPVMVVNGTHGNAE